MASQRSINGTYNLQRNLSGGGIMSKVMLGENNLSDIRSAAQARSNLGLIGQISAGPFLSITNNYNGTTNQSISANFSSNATPSTLVAYDSSGNINCSSLTTAVISTPAGFLDISYSSVATGALSVSGASLLSSLNCSGDIYSEADFNTVGNIYCGDGNMTGIVTCSNLTCVNISSPNTTISFGNKNLTNVGNLSMPSRTITCSNMTCSNMSCSNMTCSNITSSGLVSCSNITSSGLVSCSNMTCSNITSSGLVSCSNMSCSNITSTNPYIAFNNKNFTNVGSISATNLNLSTGTIQCGHITSSGTLTIASFNAPTGLLGGFSFNNKDFQNIGNISCGTLTCGNISQNSGTTLTARTINTSDMIVSNRLYTAAIGHPNDIFGSVGYHNIDCNKNNLSNIFLLDTFMAQATQINCDSYCDSLGNAIIYKDTSTGTYISSNWLLNNMNIFNNLYTNSIGPYIDPNYPSIIPNITLNNANLDNVGNIVCSAINGNGSGLTNTPYMRTLYISSYTTPSAGQVTLNSMFQALNFVQSSTATTTYRLCVPYTFLSGDKYIKFSSCVKNNITTVSPSNPLNLILNIFAEGSSWSTINTSLSTGSVSIITNNVADHATITIPIPLSLVNGTKYFIVLNDRCNLPINYLIGEIEMYVTNH
jgi:hypothetical protein